ncbi:three-helix bundle dimerization domain-containing protein [Streptomyces sp. NPDC006785]|uniref:three-helix bundle dimerization domain-containing protein n=1 Tax=Streptomyces sp. NPDC006785 TaxID=3155461 RepID=UPI0033F10CC3
MEYLGARFPHHDEQTVAETVYATHARLREGTTVSTHPAVFIQRQAGDALARMLPKRPLQQA